MAKVKGDLLVSSKTTSKELEVDTFVFSKDGSLDITNTTNESPVIINVFPKLQDGTKDCALALCNTNSLKNEDSSLLLLGYISEGNFNVVGSVGGETNQAKDLLVGVAQEEDLNGLVFSKDGSLAFLSTDILLNTFTENPSIILKGSDQKVFEVELTGHGNKTIIVNPTENGLSFIDQPTIISENTTVTVGAIGCDFTSINAALNSLKNVWIAAGVEYIIEVQNEILEINESITPTNPRSDLVKIIGVPFETTVVDIEIEKDSGVTFPPENVNAEDNTISIANHGFVNGDYVYFESTDTLPAGIEWNRVYAVRDATQNTFKLRFFIGTTNIIDQGSGTHTIKRYDSEMTITIDSGDTLPADIVGKYIKINKDAFYLEENIGSYKITERLSDTTLKATCSPWQNNDTNVYAAKILTTVKSKTEYAVLCQNAESLGLIDNIAFEADYTESENRFGICSGKYEGNSSTEDINTIGGSISLGTDVHAHGFAVGYMATMGGKLEASGTSASRNFIAGYGAFLNGVIACPNSSANESFFYAYYAAANSTVMADSCNGSGGEYGCACQGGHMSANSSYMKNFASFGFGASGGTFVGAYAKALSCSVGFLSFFNASDDFTGATAEGCGFGFYAAYNGSIEATSSEAINCNTDYSPEPNEQGNLGGIILVET
jgi:hypothetical protein